MGNGDKFPLKDIIDKALSFTIYALDVENQTDLKAVLLQMLGVSDKKGKIYKQSDDGFGGWFRVDRDIDGASDLSEEFYLNVHDVILNEFKKDSDDIDFCLGICAEMMVETLHGWSLNAKAYDNLRICIEKKYFYAFFNKDLEQMISYIKRILFTNGKPKDKATTMTLNVLEAVKKANLALPVGLNSAQEREMTKIFNFDSDWVGKVPFLTEFLLDYEEFDEDNEKNRLKNENDIVTPIEQSSMKKGVSKVVSPDGKKGGSKVVSRDGKKGLSKVVTPDGKSKKLVGEKRSYGKQDNSSRKKAGRNVEAKSAEVYDVEDSDDEEEKDEEEELNGGEKEEQSEDGEETVSLHKRQGLSSQKKRSGVRTVTNDVHQKHVGKSSILAMIACQAPVLHGTAPGEDNGKRLCVSFTTPIRQTKGTYKVAMFIDSINNGNQIYTWKAKPLVHAFGIAKMLNNLCLGDKNDPYCSLITKNINRYLPIRKYSGESNDEIKKAGSAFLLQAAGILEVRLPSNDKEVVHRELDLIVRAFRKVISDPNFHECYSLGGARSYIEEFKNSEVFLEHIQALHRTGQSFDYSKHKLARDIYQDKDLLFRGIDDLRIEIIKDCPLDVLLKNSDIKEIGRALFGHYYNDVYASIVFKNPRGKDFKTL
mmetsp:Transcript_6059/g.11485  ORF Transcript_6059/g.11485 Transcript_6059/m.11485 type:complete len:650 (+) Transcript_6059:277-2226(+)